MKVAVRKRPQLMIDHNGRCRQVSRAYSLGLCSIVGRIVKATTQRRLAGVESTPIDKGFLVAGNLSRSD